MQCARDGGVTTARIMGILTVIVPHGLVAGDAMSVEARDGNAYTVEIPPGVRGGMEMDVDLPDGPDEPSSSSSALQQVEVVVPDGVFPGQGFTVEFDGTTFEIACPDGCGPGSAILVEVPQPEPEPPPAATSELPDQSHFKFQPGQRVELIRAGRADEEVTSSGNIVYGFEGVFDTCYKVKLDNGLFKEAVPEDEISGEVTSDMGDLFGGWG